MYYGVFLIAVAVRRTGLSPWQLLRWAECWSLPGFFLRCMMSRGGRYIRGAVALLAIVWGVALWLVALMHGDRLSYAPSFEEVLTGLIGDAPRRPEPRRPETLADQNTRQLAEQAQEAFDNYLRDLSDQQFQQAATELERLRDVLQRLVEPDAEAAGRETPGAIPGVPNPM
jgi:hypothetical protein